MKNKIQSIRKKNDFYVNKLRYLEAEKVTVIKKMGSIVKTVSVCEIKRHQYSDVDSSLWLV